MTRATGTPAARGDNSPLTSRIDENHPGALADLAERTARLAGDMLSSRRSAVLADPSNITAKGSATDLVTALDRESEALIRNQIAAERPSHRFIGEESAGVETVSSGADGELTWIVDPIDGTTNFVRGYPMWCVSIAVWDGAGPLAAAVFIPTLAEMYTAVRGGGAHCNGETLGCSNPTSLGSIILATGFSYSPERRAEQVSGLATVMSDIADVRRSGSAAADLCFVAAGRVDFYVEVPLSVWDFAAGQLIASEAGALVETVAVPRLGPHVYGVSAGSPAAWDLGGDRLATACGLTD